jgi:colicin import membrane protein
MSTRLKVFQAHLGFFDTVVAAPSQKAALQAWGSRQDLFHDGAASLAADPEAVKAALAKPGIVLKRLSGSNDTFVEQPALPEVKAPARKEAKIARRVGPPSQPKPLPNRSTLDAAERALSELKRERQETVASFEERQRALARERKQAERDLDAKQKDLERRLAEEKRSYQKLVREHRGQV